jgi:P-type E1-E2 ATPase
MSRLARSGIILRRPAALEAIVGAKKIFFDKTGTLTLGEPTLKSIEIKEDLNISENDIISIASSIEIHSLHPLAKAITGEAERRGIKYQIAGDVKEKIGEGISGSVSGTRYNIRRAEGKADGITLTLRRTGLEIAKLHFEDTLKEGTADFLDALRKRGVEIAVITGDSMENAKRVFKGININIFASVTPEGKYKMIEDAHKMHQIVAMVGDGLNDAPALARSDVGIVFSGSENGASIEAAEVVMLDHKIEKLGELFSASYRTLSIAKQSIYGGIILSSLGMVFAAFGFIPPVTGAFIQEAIDIIVILNALRALKA